MRHVQHNFRGLSLFLDLAADRALAAGTIGAAVMFAAWLQSL